MRRVRLCLAAVFAAGLTWLLAVWPPPIWYRTHWPRETAFMAMRGDRGNRRYRPVPLDSLSPALAEAAIIGEDNNFYQHGGIDYLALARALGYTRPRLSLTDAGDRRALLAVLPQAWSRRDRLRGASTITQQLAKNLYLSPSRNPLRKLKEGVTAWRLERALGKRRIMELYLNVAELGGGIWGAEAASQRYFHRSAARLTEDQAAALAGALPFPRSSNPDHRPGRMHWRQNLILRRMHGEWVEVPAEEEEATGIVPRDSIQLPTVDSLLAPIDSITPLLDSLVVPPPDSGPALPPSDSGPAPPA